MTLTKTVTEKQLEANRRNSLKSTGPTSDDGKSVSSRNARKHGMFSGDLIVKFGCFAENVDDYNELLKQLIDELQPLGRMQNELVRLIVDDFWRLRRGDRWEAGELIRQGDSQLERLNHQEQQLVLREDASGSPSLTVRQMEDLEATVLDALEELGHRCPLADDLLDALANSLPGELWEELLALHSQFKGLIDVQDTFGKNERENVRVELLRKLKMLPLSEWQQIAKDRRDHAAGVDALLHSVPSSNSMGNLLRYQTMYRRQIERNLRLLQQLQRTRTESPFRDAQENGSRKLQDEAITSTVFNAPSQSQIE